MGDSLGEALASWDGKDIAAAKRIYANWSEDAAFLDTLIRECSSEHRQVAASWLIKHHHEHHKLALSARQIDTLVGAAEKLKNWVGRLHFLQILEDLPISNRHRNALEDFVEQCLSNEKTLVRAWALYGLAVLGNQYADFKPEALARLTMAKNAETAGSIKVRVRKGLELLSTAPTRRQSS